MQSYGRHAMFKLPCGIEEVGTWRPGREFRLEPIRARKDIVPMSSPHNKGTAKVPASLCKIIEALDGEKRKELEKLLGRKL